MTVTRRALLTALVATPAVAALPGRAFARSVDADALMDAAFAAHAPPAMAGAIVSRDGVVWSGVRGVRDASGTEPVTPADRWHLGSNTKAMTAALFARLVEQGRADWDMRVATVFPSITADPAWSDITVSHLMQHRAGLQDTAVIGMAWLMTARDDPRTLPEQRAAIAASALAVAPTGTPGTFEYGNANYILVGAVIETITGMAWEDAMRAEVFQPLGLTTAGFGPPPAPNAVGHRSTPAGPVAVPPGPGADNPLALGPAGTVHMAIGDYARFVSVMMGASQTWLSAASIARLTTPEPGADYALGWIARREAWAGNGGIEGPTLAHEGTNTMWHAIVVAAPERDRAFIALANMFGAGRQANVALVRGLIAAHSGPERPQG